MRVDEKEGDMVMNYSPIIFNNTDPRKLDVNLFQEDDAFQEEVLKTLKAAKDKMKSTGESKFMSMWREDITFCANRNCPHIKCMRHRANMPKGVPVSVAMFTPGPSGKCDLRFDEDWETVETKGGE